MTNRSDGSDGGGGSDNSPMPTMPTPPTTPPTKNHTNSFKEEIDVLSIGTEQTNESVSPLHSAYKGQSVLLASSDDEEDPSSPFSASSAHSTKKLASTNNTSLHDPSVNSSNNVFNNDDNNKDQSFYQRYKIYLFYGAILFVSSVVALAIMGAKGTLTRSKSNHKETESLVNLVVEEELEVGVVELEPSLSPTASPSVRPQWETTYLGIKANFGTTTGYPIILNYEIGINRQYIVELYSLDCASPIEGIDLQLTPVRSPKDMYTEFLTLNYDMDMTKLKSSNIWNDNEDKMQFCIKLQLVEYYDEEEELYFVINEDASRIDINVDFTTSFGIGGLEIGLASAANGTENGGPPTPGNDNDNGPPDGVVVGGGGPPDGKGPQ